MSQFNSATEVQQRWATTIVRSGTANGAIGLPLLVVGIAVALNKRSDRRQDA